MFARFLGLKTISPRRLHRLMQHEPMTAIDVNPQVSWGKAHVPGAVNLDPVAFGEDDLPPDKDSLLVFYCSTYLCTKAPRAARRAAAMGYRRVHVMSAGINGWLRAGLVTESGELRAARRPD